MKIYVHFDQNEIDLGTLISETNNSVCLKDPKNKEITCNTNRLYYLGDYQDGLDLNQINLKAEELWPAIEIPKLWEAFKKKASVPGAELTIKHFGTDLPEQHFALFLAVHHEKVYFKRKSQEFHLRTEKEVAERLLNSKKDQTNQLELQATLEFLRDNISNLQGLPEIAQRLVNNLLAFAAESRDLLPDEKKEAREFLKELIKILKITDLDPIPASAYQILLKLGVINNYADLILIRHHQSLSFTKQALQECKKLAVDYPKIIQDKNRKDLTKVPMFTIDDQSTLDMDDAISLEQTIDGWQLGIHISDISALIAKGSVLDKLALKRATSVYSTGQNINMLPAEISENLGSLLAGETRPALTIHLNLDRHYNLLSSKIFPSLIKVTERLSYQQVDRLLEAEDSRFVELYQITNQFETKRLESGAIKTPKKVSDTKLVDGKLTLEIFDEHDFARNIIAELMIIANKIFAEYASQNFLPAFFRCQEAPEQTQNDAGQQNPEQFKPSYTSLTAKPHHALGLNAYLQATSPIRRYQDLCNQRQIISHLKTKKTELDRKDLEKIKKLTFAPLKEAVTASKESRRYWLLRYVAENYPKGSEFTAQVIKNDKKLGMVTLKDLIITGLVALPQSMNSNTEIKVRLLAVNPEKNDLKLELIA